MKRVFEKIKAVCRICGEPTDERYKIGDKFYCADHFQKESIEEKRGNRENEIALKKHKKFVAGL